MTSYKAPLRDIRFVANELLNFESHYDQLFGETKLTADDVDAILNEAAKFFEAVVAPLNQSGDREGCEIRNGEVTTPKGFKEAYQQYCEAGWPGMLGSPEFGGQGLPISLGGIFDEMRGCANKAWGMYAALSEGAINAIEIHGSDAQKSKFLPNLVTGAWSGTMCLTEPHAGTDLGLMRTRATENDDGSFSISGTKIFISSGDHDLTENIVHIVLARIADAPDGVRGISLFIVPKFNVDEDGLITDRNGVFTGSIEHKMGIRGNATCVLNFENARGYLVGEPNRGLVAMFTFMNAARLATAHEGVQHAELGLQNSLEYARERLQGRSPSGAQSPNKSADPIIVHPDVRRMLLTQKAIAEGGRIFIYYCYQLVDITLNSDDESVRRAADDMLSYLTPIAKAFLTELGLESANLGMQCFGGHGYIQEWGMEQNVRDARISTLYEGTTGIQALDLLGRKVIGTDGKLFNDFVALIRDFCEQNAESPHMQVFTRPLERLGDDIAAQTSELSEKARADANEAGAAAVDYLMASGYLVTGYFLALAAAKAYDVLSGKRADEPFYRAKIVTARFYFERILPRATAHLAAVSAGAVSIMELEAGQF